MNASGRTSVASVGPSDSTSPRTILLAEDDDDLRSLVARGLRRDGHRVVEARNGSELRADLACAHLRGPDGDDKPLVVTDLRLPISDGLSVIRGLRARGVEVPFILMTAFGDPETHEEAVRLGALVVLDKPFDFADLRRAVVSFVLSQQSP